MVAKKKKEKENLIIEKEVNPKDIQEKWYIFRVQSGREDSLLQALKNNLPKKDKDGIDGKDYFIDFASPKRTIIKYDNKNKKTEKELNVYPGYIFLRLKMTDRVQIFLRNFFKKNGFGSMLPNAISDEEYDRMMSSVGDLSEKAKTFTFAIGQKVKINAGSFASMEGNIDTINNDEKKLVVSVMIFGCETKVDVDFDQVSIIKDKDE